jgi:hypothetical protein
MDITSSLGAAERGPLPTPLTTSWLPAGGPHWLESRRRWHAGQLAAYERTLAALRAHAGGDYEGLAEAERLAAAELLRIVSTIAGDLRNLDELVARRVDCTDRAVWGVRRWLRLDPDQSATAVAA